MKKVLLSLILLSSQGAFAQHYNGVEDDSFNEEIIEWCQRRTGSHVGGGKCIDIADRALKKIDRNYRKRSKYNWVWGKRIRLEEVKAGDIVVFNWTRFVVETETTISVSKAYRHIGVVRGIKGDTLLTYEQSSTTKDGIVGYIEGLKGRLKEDEIILTSLHRGSLKFYRPTKGKPANRHKDSVNYTREEILCFFEEVQSRDCTDKD